MSALLRQLRRYLLKRALRRAEENAAIWAGRCQALDATLTHPCAGFWTADRERAYGKRALYRARVDRLCEELEGAS